MPLTEKDRKRRRRRRRKRKIKELRVQLAAASDSARRIKIIEKIKRRNPWLEVAE